MKITNRSNTVVKASAGVIVEETLQLSDLLPAGTAQQYQDGIRNVVIKPGEYWTIPNYLACNSIGFKTLYDSADWGDGAGSGGKRLGTDKTVEPTGADPTHEINGPIFGMTAL